MIVQQTNTMKNKTKYACTRMLAHYEKTNEICMQTRVCSTPAKAHLESKAGDGTVVELDVQRVLVVKAFEHADRVVVSARDDAAVILKKV